MGSEVEEWRSYLGSREEILNERRLHFYFDNQMFLIIESVPID